MVRQVSTIPWLSLIVLDHALVLQIPSEKVFRSQKTPNTVSEGVWSCRDGMIFESIRLFSVSHGLEHRSGVADELSFRVRKLDVVCGHVSEALEFRKREVVRIKSRG